MFDEHVAQSGRRRQHAASCAAAWKLVGLERERQRRLAEKHGGGAVAGIAVVSNQPARLPAILGDARAGRT